MTLLSLSTIACRNHGIDSVSCGDERRGPTYATGEPPTFNLIKHVLGCIRLETYFVFVVCMLTISKHFDSRIYAERDLVQLATASDKDIQSV